MMTSDLNLPQLSASCSGSRVLKEVLIVAGGRSPERNWLKKTCQKRDLLWAVDRGLDICLEAGLVPDRIIGDFDSVSAKILQSAVDRGIPATRFPAEKDFTDLQLALRTLGEEQGPLEVLVSGCWGGRFDHNFSNIYSLLWARDWNLNVSGMADEKEVLLFLEGPAELVLRTDVVPGVVSLLSLSSVCREVSISGVRWELQKKDLSLERPFAVSNHLMPGRKTCRVSLAEGTLGVYLNWNVAEKR